MPRKDGHATTYAFHNWFHSCQSSCNHSCKHLRRPRTLHRTGTGRSSKGWLDSIEKQKNIHYAFCTHRDLRENVWCKNRNTNTHRIRCALDTISAIRPSWELMSSPTHQRTQFLLNPAHWSLTLWPGSNLTSGADTGDNNYCVCNDLATKGKILGYRMSVRC